LFQVMFALQNAPFEAMRLPALSLRPVELEATSARFDLSLTLAAGPEGFSGGLSYDLELFEPSTAARMMDHLRALLEGAVENPDERIGALALMRQEERQRVLEEWNATSAHVPADACIHHLFQAQAARTPEAIALSFEDSSLSFRELDERANQLAWHLRSLGVGPEVIVGLCVERSPDMVVGMLGILKAGGAFLPLDPSLPPERLAFMLQDAAVPVLLTQRRLRTSLPVDLPTFCLDSQQRTLDSQPHSPPGSSVRADSLAYVIYTSGTTGRPKGTLLAHRGLCNTALAAVKFHGFTPTSRILQFASFGFDACVCEVFSSLLAGACLVLATREQLLPGPALREVVSRQRISAATLTPSVLALLEPQGLALHTVISVGEACTPPVLERWAPHVRLLNAYGPTEASVCATISQPLRPGDVPTIGRPWDNVQVFLLDAQLRPVPVGVPGELFIGGVGLARGYLGNPALTAERFVPHPFSSLPGQRLYRSGDKARWLPEGRLEFLGRLDSQVKVRGFRVEPGEVQSVLRSLPAVRDAAVLAHPDGSGQPRLVAYVVPSLGHSPTSSSLRDSLRRLLPDYMLPSSFLLLERLPLSPSGKLDLSSLPSPEHAGHELQQTFIPPRELLELEVARAFEEVLALRPIGAHGHFFELGGHSLLAVRLLALVAERTGQRLPVSVLFQAPTVEGLAAALRTGVGPWSPLVPIQRGGSRQPFFCVHPVGGNVLAYAELARLLGPEQPFYGLQSQGLDGSLPPLERVEEMAAFYLEALRTIQPHGPYLLGGWSMGGVVAFEMARQLQARRERVALLALIDPSPARSGQEEPEEDVGPDMAALFASDLGQLTSPPLAESLLDVDAGPPQLHALLDVFSHNMRALRRYVPRCIEGRATVLRAADSVRVGSEEDDRGWGQKVSGGVELLEVPGDHYGILRPPHVQVLAEHLMELLDRARAADTEERRAG
ncbi:MAG: non-ribosomal peptide synthetase, partial [Archangium sp.]